LNSLAKYSYARSQTRSVVMEPWIPMERSEAPT
jgi:hypothetical protein